MSKQAAQQAKDLLTLCLAKAIQDSLTAELSPHWFQAFLRDDQAREPKFQIARNGQATIRDLDLQALLKILRYRDQYSDRVFAHFGCITGTDPFADQTKKRQIRSLLDRLITDFRNGIEAHSRVADIEQGDADRIYGYKEALQDMEKLSGIFATVRDNQGVSYHNRICALSKPKKKAWWLLLPVALIAISIAIFFLLPGILIRAESNPTIPTGNVYYSENPAVIPDKVTVRATYVYYEGDMLVAKCRVLNGLNEPIDNIKVDKLLLTDKDDKLIAAAGFGELEGMVLRANSYGEWCFQFPAETVLNPDADLTVVYTTVTVTYDH